MAQDAPQDGAACQGALAVALAALLSGGTSQQLAQRWLQQAIDGFPWLRWHTALSRQLAEVWDAGKEAPQGGGKPQAPAAALLQQVNSTPWRHA